MVFRKLVIAATCLCLVAGGIGVVAQGRAVEYEITDFKDNRMRWLRVDDINDKSVVVGELHTYETGGCAFIGDKEKIHNMGKFKRFELNTANAVNGKGQVVGRGYNEYGENEEAFLWENGSFTGLGTLGGESSNANDLNDSGDIVGTADTKSGANHACVWRNKKISDLGTLGGKNSIAEAINNRGEIVGYSETKAGYNRAFLWKDGHMQDLGTLGGKSSKAHAINDKGEVVGRADTVTGASHAFLWKDGKMQDLGTLGGKESSATDINNQGQIVGTSHSTVTSSFGGGAPIIYFFLYQEGKMIELNSLLPKSTGWQFEGHIGPAINNQGQIAGMGQYQEENNSFILTPKSIK